MFEHPFYCHLPAIHKFIVEKEAVQMLALAIRKTTILATSILSKHNEGSEEIYLRSFLGRIRQDEGEETWVESKDVE